MLSRVRRTENSGELGASMLRKQQGWDATPALQARLLSDRSRFALENSYAFFKTQLRYLPSVKPFPDEPLVE